MVFDIDKAIELVKGREADDTTDPRVWKQFLSTVDGSTYGLGIGINVEHSKTVDLEKPLILAIVTFPSGTKSPFVLDGWHRIAKACREGVEELPLHLLSASELKAVKVA
jgi:hypothetical protein